MNTVFLGKPRNADITRVVGCGVIKVNQLG